MSQMVWRQQGRNRRLHISLRFINHKVGSFCLFEASFAFTDPFEERPWA